MGFEELLEIYRRGISVPPIRAGAEGLGWQPPALSHARWMLDNMPDRQAEPEKFHRWLGFVQGVMWESGIYTIDQFREQTRRAGGGL